MGGKGKNEKKGKKHPSSSPMLSSSSGTSPPPAGPHAISSPSPFSSLLVLAAGPFSPFSGSDGWCRGWRSVHSGSSLPILPSLSLSMLWHVSSIGWSPSGVCLFHYNVPPTPLTMCSLCCPFLSPLLLLSPHLPIPLDVPQCFIPCWIRFPAVPPLGALGSRGAD